MRTQDVPLSIIWADADIDPLSEGHAQYKWAVENLQPEHHLMLKGAGHLSFADAPVITANQVAKLAAKFPTGDAEVLPVPQDDVTRDPTSGAEVRA